MARTAKITNANVAPSKNKAGLVGNTPVRAQDFNDLAGDYISSSDTNAQSVASALTASSTLAVTGAATLSSTLQVGGLLTAANLTAAKGTDLADDTAAITLTAADHGKTFLCLLDGAAKTVNLPASTSATDVGTQITIIQNADLVGSGVLTINANTGNTFALNSYAIGYNSSRFLAATRPADANNRIVITGAATNSAWGIGSVAIFTCVAAGEWHFAIKAEPLGNGNDAIAFSTV
tara:strand:+ start:43 stop:747 length:705 start_codon:yes stop_codon:yes gene_type:complete